MVSAYNKQLLRSSESGKLNFDSSKIAMKEIENGERVMPRVTHEKLLRTSAVTKEPR